MNLLVDMNLSPEWVEVLRRPGWVIRHWGAIGAKTAKDAVILEWARRHDFIVLTQDLDFVQLLHSTLAAGPSVVLLRAADEHDEVFRRQVGRVLAEHAQALREGAILVLDERRARLRALPLPAPKPRRR